MPHPLSKFSFCPVCGSNHFAENNFKSKKCSSCGFVYYFNASSAVVAVILNDAGELLVARRGVNPAKGTLDLPGGFADMDETLEEAVCREVYEELNIKVKELKYLLSKPNVYPYSGFEVHTLDSFFMCRVEDFAAMRVGDDVSEAFFLNVTEIKVQDFGLPSIRSGLLTMLSESLLVT